MYLIQNDSDYNSDIYWVIRVFSSDSLAFVKDTIKEDGERTVKDSWEINQPGRSEKAKMARKKYIAEIKKNNGEILTPEEEQILFERRSRRVTMATSVNPNPTMEEKANDKKTRAIKKIGTVNNISIPANMQNPFITSFYKLNLDKPLPRPEQHNSLFLKNFLDYTYKNRKIIKNSITDGKGMRYILIFLVHCRTEEEKLQFMNDINSKADEYQSKKVESDVALNEKKVPTIQELNANNIKRRNKKRDENNLILKEREMIIESMLVNQENEKKLEEIINYDGSYEINYYVQCYKEVSSSNYKGEDMIKRAHEVLSMKKEEMYINDLKKFTIKDKSTILKYIEEINTFNWLISEEIMKKFQELSR